MLNIIQYLRQQLVELSSESISVATVCASFRAQHELLAILPPQFGEVLENLLSRLEAGSLFTEESCSFSQAELLAQLGLWLDKATTRLEK